MSHLPAACVVPVETFGQHPAEDPEQFHPLNRQEVVPEGCQRDGTGWVQARGGATADGCRGMVQILRGKRAEPGTSGPDPVRPRGRRSLILLYPPRLRVCKVRVVVGSVFTLLQSRSTNTLSNARPRPSMLTATPALSRQPVNASAVNCTPWCVFDSRQAITYRLYQSITAARYMNPPVSGT